MLRGIYGNTERYVNQYWSRWPGVYFTSDGAKRDQDGNIWRADISPLRGTVIAIK